MAAKRRSPKRSATRTRSFGAGRREGHDSSPFYERNLKRAEVTLGRAPATSSVADEIFTVSSEDMSQLLDDSVALMVTSPPYHVGKDYDGSGSFEDYLDLLRRVLKETYRVLEPGGRAVINVANLGRRPYIPLAAHVNSVMEDLGYLPRGEVIWVKGKGASGSCAWGSWRSATNPTLRDTHEYCLAYSKERWDRARRGDSSISRDEFLESTLSVWEIQPESAGRVGHPAPFPVELPRRFIELYSYVGDLILDPFLGSGSTAVAAVQAGRRFVGYETNADYVAIARERVAAAKKESSS